MRKIINKVQKFVKEEDAASAVEYGLLLAFISLGIITALQALGNKLSSNFTTLSNALNTASNSGGGGVPGGGVHPPPGLPVHVNLSLT